MLKTLESPKPQLDLAAQEETPKVGKPVLGLVKPAIEETYQGVQTTTARSDEEYSLGVVENQVSNTWRRERGPEATTTWHILSF